MKNVGLLKFVLVALMATSGQVSFGMAADQAAQAPVEQEPAQQAQCTICLGEPGDDGYLQPQVLHDDHAMCPGCFTEQIEAAHKNRNGAEKKENQMIHCPHDGCDHVITEADVHRIAPNYLAQFQEIHQAKQEKIDAAANKVRIEDRESREWQYQNTKPCPRCHTAIEKNSGCKWILCTNCHHEFCYECLHLSRVPNHEVHPCQRVSQERAWAAERARENSNPQLAIGAVVVLGAIWGIYELYNYFTSKKSKKPGIVKKPIAAKKVQPAGARKRTTSTRATRANPARRTRVA